MTIDDIEKSLPSGFHDADLKRMDINYQEGTITLEMEIDTSIKMEEEYKSGKITLSGIIFCAIEPPDFQYRNLKHRSPWIAGSGPVTSSTQSSDLLQSLPEGAFVHCFYVNNWNSSIYLAAMDAKFEWI